MSHQTRKPPPAHSSGDRSLTAPNTQGSGEWPGGGRQARFPHLLPFPPAVLCGAGRGILSAAMATDGDDSSPGPVTRTTLGCELIKQWAHHLRQGRPQPQGPAARPRGASGFWAVTWLLSSRSFRPEGTGSPCALPSPQGQTLRWFPSRVSISVILFCFLKIPPARGSRRRRCSLAVPFFQKRSVGWWVGTERPPQTWPCVPKGEQQARQRLWEERRWQRPPRGLSVILKINR